ncbi:MAG: HAMP domain-containing histidine kinase [Bacteroidales bacterium]|nr:HAMP domain-containing histidine kinase [Bacteroidales bacterium]
MSNNLHQARWKWLLFVTAAIVFVFIIYHSNKLINNIAQEERKRIEIWAGAISYKAQFVNETERFFNSIKLEEGNHAKILASAIQRMTQADWDEDLTFYQEIISSNKTIPLIVTSAGGNIDAAANVPDSIANMKNIREMGDAIKSFDSLKLRYLAHHYLTVYYQESPMYGDLHVVIDNLVQSFFQETVINSASVPVIITDSTKHNVLNAGKIDSATLCSAEALGLRLEKMKSENPPIELNLTDMGKCYVFYEESSVLKKLRIFPYIQFGFILIFVIIAYLLFSTTRRSEQNRVWVGMSKETAHQLGTPISSLMAWTELLKEMPVDQSIPTEIGKDVHRLETIAQRFSKIGSAPVLEPTDLVQVIEDFSQYLQSRISSKVSITFNKPETESLVLPLNRYLFEWVIENLCKNSVDAMNGEGSITIDVTEDKKKVFVDITDTGKGIPNKLQKRIFSPGYTSKSRGWGLGLTLARRIINEYHKGKLFVKSSVIDQGTVMRIQLKK